MCEMDMAIPYEELEQRRKKAGKIRELSQAPAHQNVETDSEALNVINEIFNPSLKLPETKGPYKMPDVLTADDVDAPHELDVRKLAELKEVFALFDTDCDGLISKDDLRFTYTALGGDVTEEILEEMLKEAKEPLDYDAFVQLMSYRTVELDPEDVLLEAWSKWDIYGTGKVDENKCLDYIELFPYLREPVIENTTSAEYVICNHTASALKEKNDDNNQKAITANSLDVHIVRKNTFIYSAGKIFGIRVRFIKSNNRSSGSNGSSDSKIMNINSQRLLNITGDYRYFKKENFRNDGRLIQGSYCDYYFFANTDPQTSTQNMNVWKYFHSPRFPANYPTHIKCAYKFIGRPESRVEIIFEELQMPKQGDGCNMDKVSIFDSESTNTHHIIDVICDSLPKNRIISSGPDLLIEFNVSSNFTGKGFRGKYKFIHNEVVDFTTKGAIITAEGGIALEKLSVAKQTQTFNSLEYPNLIKLNENCKQVFDSRHSKSGSFQTSPILMNGNAAAAVHCRYEFYGLEKERIQIKFHDFYMPTDSRNSSECKITDSLQLLTQMHGKFEVTDLFCGAFIPKPIMSDGPTLFLQFSGKYPTTGSKVSYYGFKAEYKFLTNFGITTGHHLNDNCSFQYNSTERKSGWFASPNYPGLYPQNIICNYYFYGEPNEKILIRFTYFDVEGVGTCEHLTASDFVEFSNFMSMDRKFGRFCGKRDKFQIHSDARFFRITFHSNDRFDKTGFRALFDFETNYIAPENTSMQSYVASSSKVGTTKSVNFFLLLIVTKVFIALK